MAKLVSFLENVCQGLKDNRVNSTSAQTVVLVNDHGFTSAMVTGQVVPLV
jgi:hypothetical protein